MKFDMSIPDSADDLDYLSIPFRRYVAAHAGTCPFCGSHISILKGINIYWMVICHKCGFMGTFEYDHKGPLDKFIERFNSRVGVDTNANVRS